MNEYDEQRQPGQPGEAGQQGEAGRTGAAGQPGRPDQRPPSGGGSGDGPGFDSPGFASPGFDSPGSPGFSERDATEREVAERGAASDRDMPARAAGDRGFGERGVGERAVGERSTDGQGGIPGPRSDPSGSGSTGPGAARSEGPRSAEGAPVLPQGERDKLSLRLQQAVNSFVDEPRRSVEEADAALEETAARLADVIAQRRSSLRTGWRGDGKGAARSESGHTETEELRVALRRYRDLVERLLNV
ncbi:hypothetical protein [Streptomyces sp. H27-D2]|uniref:hypothetical protein n=1 Tax=Streptomyces sp. H27-D2 TaxID=3046304 RepID=UPI002DB9CF00|nr:hypothetical protein [Streptomyces sp. H27-D2]MEC4016223.1 hypothetical protein [Streptomyces sp. H27-D2]